MTEYRNVLERELERLAPPRIPVDRLVRRRDRKRRNQRIAAGLVAVAVFVAAISGLFGAFSGRERTGDEGPSPRPSVRVPADLSFVNIDTGREHPLPSAISDLGGVRDIDASLDGKRLAFEALSGRDPVRQVFVADIDGSDIRQLTFGDDIEFMNPSWSSDGMRLVVEGSSGVGSDIFVVDVATGSITPLGLDLPDIPYISEHAPTFSADGTEILYARADDDGSQVGLWTVPAAGGESKRLVRAAAFGAFSPDGRSLAYRYENLRIPGFGSGIVVTDADGTHRRSDGGAVVMGYPLVQPDPEDSSPEWSPNGSKVLYSEEFGDGSMKIFDLERNVTTTFGRGAYATWLDDSTLIVSFYQALEEDASRSPSPSPSPPAGTASISELNFVDLATGAVSPLPGSIRSVPDVHSLQVSPDGSMFTFEAATEPGGLRQVYVADVDGSNIRRISRGAWQAIHPSWAPDGTRIVYEDHTPGRGVRISVVDVAGGSRTRVARLAVGATYAAMPRFSADGTSILFTREGDQSIGLWLEALNGGPEGRVLGGAAFGSYSPDGGTLVYRHAGLMPGLQTGISFFGDIVPPDGAHSGSFPMGFIYGVDDFDSPSAMPLWSPDGSRVLYTDPFAGDDGSYPFHIFGLSGDWEGIRRTAPVNAVPFLAAGEVAQSGRARG